MSGKTFEGEILIRTKLITILHPFFLKSLLLPKLLAKVSKIQMAISGDTLKMSRIRIIL